MIHHHRIRGWIWREPVSIDIACFQRFAIKSDDWVLDGMWFRLMILCRADNLDVEVGKLKYSNRPRIIEKKKIDSYEIYIYIIPQGVYFCFVESFAGIRGWTCCCWLANSSIWILRRDDGERSGGLVMKYR